MNNGGLTNNKKLNDWLCYKNTHIRTHNTSISHTLRQLVQEIPTVNPVAASKTNLIQPGLGLETNTLTSNIPCRLDSHIETGLDTSRVSAGLGYKLEPDVYDEFLNQFNLIARANSWDENQQMIALAANLRGKARTVLNNLSNNEALDFDNLISIWWRFFNSSNDLKLKISSLGISLVLRRDSR